MTEDMKRQAALSQTLQGLNQGGITSPHPANRMPTFQDELRQRRKIIQDTANRNLEHVKALEELIEYLDAHTDASDLLNRVHQYARY